MKTINIPDGVYEFLVETGKNILAQDNRCTREPIVFVIESKCEEMRPEGYAEKQKIVDEEGNELSVQDIAECVINDLAEATKKMILYTEPEITEQALKEAADLSDIFNIIDIDDYIRLFRDHWTLVHYDEMFRPKTSEGGFFLTEKAAEAHLKINGHHYREPRTYVEYANRNPEIENLVKFLKAVATQEQNRNSRHAEA
jgi:hypothetical protein